MIAIIQSRLGSSRLPGKVLAKVSEGMRLLDCVVRAVRASGVSSEIVLATSTNAVDDRLIEYAAEKNIRCFRGNEQNVLARFISAMQQFEVDACIRVCSDNPWIDPVLITEVAREFDPGLWDYCGFRLADGRPAICAPKGLFAEAVSLTALRRLQKMAPSLEISQHVTLGVYRDGNSRCKWLVAPDYAEYEWLRLTVDTAEDLNIQREMFCRFTNDIPRRELVERVREDESLRLRLEMSIANASKSY